MKIAFKKNKVSYENLVKLLFVGHVFGFGILIMPIFILLVLLGLTGHGEGVGPEALLTVIVLPLILIGQAVLLSLVYRVGFWLYGLIRPIQIEVVE